jgi:hypothetical protein
LRSVGRISHALQLLISVIEGDLGGLELIFKRFRAILVEGFGCFGVFKLVPKVFLNLGECQKSDWGAIRRLT